jgi:hypothetical protein
MQQQPRSPAAGRPGRAKVAPPSATWCQPIWEENMHAFFLMGAVLHTIIVAVVAFFVLFAASKADGFVRLLGYVLGWILLLGAAAGLAFGIYCVATGQHPPFGPDRDHHGWMMGWHHDEGEGAPPLSAAPSAQPKSK